MRSPGTSLASRAAVVLANVLPTTRTVWIEHYEDGARGMPQDRATFDLLTFSGGDAEPVLRAGVWRVELGSPSWKALDRATWRRWSGLG